MKSYFSPISPLGVRIHTDTLPRENRQNRTHVGSTEPRKQTVCTRTDCDRERLDGLPTAAKSFFDAPRQLSSARASPVLPVLLGRARWHID